MSEVAQTISVSQCVPRMRWAGVGRGLCYHGSGEGSGSVPACPANDAGLMRHEGVHFLDVGMGRSGTGTAIALNAARLSIVTEVWTRLPRRPRHYTDE